MLEEVHSGYMLMKRISSNTASLQTSEYLGLFGQNGHMLKNVAIYKELKFKIFGKILLSVPQMSVLNGLGNGLIGNWQHNLYVTLSCCVAGCTMRKLLISALTCHS
jgi:hypothetical protein